MPSPGERAEECVRSRVAFNVVYLAYERTKDGYILTPDGPVEVPWDHIARIEGSARKVEDSQQSTVDSELALFCRL